MSNKFSIALFCVVAFPVSTIAQSKPSRPDFLAFVPEIEFEARLTEVMRNAGGIKTLEQSNIPEIGQIITQVLPDGTAEQIGMKAGDVIAKINGEAPWGGSLKLFDNKRSAVEYYAALTNKRQTKFVQSDRLKIVCEPIWHPEQTFLRGKQRSDKYDQFMVAAALTLGTDPEFAETALQRSIQNGYVPDSLSDQLGLDIALIQNRMGDAQQFSRQLESKFEEDETINPLLLIKVGFATGNFQLVAKVMEHQQRYASQSDSSSEAMTWLAGRMPTENEIDETTAVYDEVASKMYRDDVTHRLRPARELFYPDLYPIVTKESAFKLEAPTASHEFVYLKSSLPMPSFEMSTKVKFEPNDKQVSTYLKLVQIEALSEPGAARFDKIASVSISPSGLVTLKFANAPTSIGFFDSSISLSVEKEATVKIRRVLDVIEVFINDHRVLLAPAHQGFEDVTFSLRAIGMKANFQDWTVVELIPKASP